MQPLAESGTGVPASERRPLGLALLGLAAFLALTYRDGTNSRVVVHDNMDGEFVNQVVFARSGVLFAGSDAVFAPLLGGMPRGFMPSDLFLPMLSYRLLPTFTAIVLLDALIRLAALFGMWRLLSRHVLPGRPPILLALLALGFALLPFHPNYGISVAGYPLLASACLDLGRGRDRALALITLALYPLFSSFALAGIFIVPLAGLFSLYALQRKLGGARSVLVGVGIFLLSTLIVERRMFASVLGGAVPSHRSEFVAASTTLPEALRKAFLNLVHGQYHADAVHSPLLLVLAMVLAVLLFTRPRLAPGSSGPQPTQPRWVGLSLLAATLSLSLWYGLWGWDLTRSALAATGSRTLQQISLDRIHWLHPTLWCTLGALALDELRARFALGGRLALALAAGQCLLCVRANLVRTDTSGAPFAAFYAEPLFDAVRREIGKETESYRVASLGLFPSVAMFNGFHVIDGYHSMYPLSHKRAFRGVIAGELARDATLRAYFDGWGSRCYLFSAELGRSVAVRADEAPRRVAELRVDTGAMLQLNARYLVSAVELSNPAATGLTLRRKFDAPGALWRVWLYDVNVATHPT